MWSFAAIATDEPERAARLEAAPQWEQIEKAIISKFGDALRTNTVKIGLEQHSENPNWLRAVLQFNVGEVLLDWFFNAHTGYRAQFFHDWRAGLCLSERLNMNIRDLFSRLASEQITCRLLSACFEDLGTHKITRPWLTASLEPRLSKVWACAKIMDSDGSIRPVALGLTTPKLRLPDGSYWNAISQEDSDAFLEVKGAFITPSGPCQPKPPDIRAQAIQRTGEAGSQSDASGSTQRC